MNETNNAMTDLARNLALVRALESGRDVLEAPAMSVRRVAAKFGVHEHTIRRMIARGDLPHLRFGRAVRVRLQDVERFCGHEYTGDDR